MMHDIHPAPTRATDRRRFLQHALGAAPGTAAAAQVSGGQKADRAPLKAWPTLSLKERDRRWAIVRRIMRQNNVGLLFIPAGTGADNYLTDDAEATVFFPASGDPIALAGDRSFQAVSWLTNEERGATPWVRNWRFDSRERLFPPAPAIEVEIIRELGFDKARVGTIGVSKGSHFSPGGSISHALQSDFDKHLSSVTWVELFDAFATEWLTKSEEELVLFRKAALLSEIASEAVLAVSRAGVSEAEIYYAAMCEVLHNGGTMSNIILHSGPECVSWGPPKWRVRAQKPRTIENGDIITTELFPVCAGVQAQAQMCVAVGKVADVNQKLARIARESYEIGLKTIKPGVRFSEVAAAMNQPNEREGAWHMTPNIHSLNPLYPVGPVTQGVRSFTKLIQRFPKMAEREASGMDVVLREGMCFQLEPNASLGANRVNIGGNVIVTKTGCQELNTLPCELRFVGAAS